MARYSAEHKERTREHLLETARARFREEGFDAASIDRLMKSAGLTRGGFYAHFDSKEALVHEVLAQDSGLVIALREAKTPNEATQVLDAYLSEEERPDRVQCPLVSHPMDARRGGPKRRALYADQVRGLRDELARHVKRDDDATLLTILAVGAAILSAAVSEDDEASAIERVGSTAIQGVLRREEP